VFRHVCDLVALQAEQGLQVGVVFDTATVDDVNQLEALRQNCSLGVFRFNMSRLPHPSDIRVVRQMKAICSEIKPDVIHGHGAKGGTYARLCSRGTQLKSVYTPHGGILHYKSTSLTGGFYIAIERYLKRYTSAVIFECEFSAKNCENKVGKYRCPTRVIYNALSEKEYVPVESNNPQYDFLYLGELRMLKGVDVLLKAMKIVTKKHPVRLLLAGSGPDEKYFRKLVDELGLENSVAISKPIYPASKAFSDCRVLVVPSRKESFPYTVLEAAAARVPLIATAAGGIPEIFGDNQDWLVQPDCADQLADAMIQLIESPELATRRSHQLWHHVQSLSRLDCMANEVLSLYRHLAVGHKSPLR